MVFRMDLALHLPRAFVEIPSQDESGVCLWEMKQWMRHAAICRTRTRANSFACSAYVNQTRARINDQCRPNWWRGLAFGTVLEIDELPTDSEAIFDALDVRQRSKTVWQWAIVAIERPRVVIGMHIWMRVALTPIFDSALVGYREEGYEARTFKKDKDALMKFLTTIRGLRLPEVDDETQNPQSAS